MTSPTSLMAKWRCSGVPAGSGDTQPPTGVVPCAHGHGACSDGGWTCSDAARASADWSEAWSIYPPRAGCAPDPDWATGGGPLAANFRGTRVGKKGERLSENQLNTSNKAWQQCGVEELSLIHISEPTRLRRISYAVFCLKKKTVAPACDLRACVKRCDDNDLAAAGRRRNSCCQPFRLSSTPHRCQALLLVLS